MERSPQPGATSRFGELAAARATEFVAIYHEKAQRAGREQLRYAHELNNVDYIALCEEVCAILEQSTWHRG